MSHRFSTAGVPTWLASPPLSTAIEITTGRVTGVTIADNGGSRLVSAYASEALPAGAVEAALNAPNIHDQAAVVGALKSVLSNLNLRGRRVALVIPDTVAKVSLVRFEKVPAKVQDLEQLIRWQVRKSAPFRLEDGQVSWTSGVAPAGGGREYIVTVARRDIIEGYERACDAAGVHAGMIDLATPNVINAVLATGEVPEGSDWLLVHIGADYATIVVVRGGDLVFFRNRAAAEPGDLADLVHQTAMYHEDRLGGGGFSRVIVAGGSLGGVESAERLQHALEERLGTPVEPLDFRAAAAMRDRISVAPELLSALAPAVGILLRERPVDSARGRAEKARAASRGGRVA
jgi:type IV pilus assembly protein PilM